MWIESHQSLWRHPKLGRLARSLGRDKYSAVGVLHTFWWWAVDYAPDGNLEALSADDIAVAIDWPGDPDELWNALLGSGFVDADKRIHDWHDYAGRLIEQRAAAAARLRDYRARKKLQPTPTSVEKGDNTGSPNGSTSNVHVRNEYETPAGGVRTWLTVNPDLNRDLETPTESPSSEGFAHAPAREGAVATADGASAPPLAQKRTRKKSLTDPPNDLDVTAEMLAFAVDLGVPAEQVPAQTQRFLDWHRSKGNQQADWLATWRNWMRKYRDLDTTAKPRAPTQPEPGSHGLIDWTAEIAKANARQARKLEEARHAQSR